MKAITIEDIRQEHLSTIHTLIDEIWDWSSFIRNEETLKATLSLYLDEVLRESSFGKVALANDQIIGVIFGRAETAYPHYKLLVNESLENVLALLKATNAEQRDIQAVLSGLDQSYRSLIQGREHIYHGSLNLFAVSESAQGLGIGKLLWEELQAYFIREGSSKIYVYTDSDCNYGFYDYHGFEQVSRIELNCQLMETTWAADIFLYEYKILLSNE